MKVVVLGAGGQLGQELLAAKPAELEVVPFTREELDITDHRHVSDVMLAHAPRLVINAAAYTLVDAAESHPEVALRVNAEGPGLLATLARDAGARLIHVSTDFVFDGRASEPYRPESTPRPVGVYGQSKLEGEQRILAALPSAVVLRTAWLYSARGRNFVNTMLRLMATRDSIGVVMDQVGSPTSARSLAEAIWVIACKGEIGGLQHWCDAGVASWFDFAVAIQEEALFRGLLNRKVAIRAIRTADYPTPARRPAYSVLDTRETAGLLGIEPPYWRDSLRNTLDELVVA